MLQEGVTLADVHVDATHRSRDHGQASGATPVHAVLDRDFSVGNYGRLGYSTSTPACREVTSSGHASRRGISQQRTLDLVTPKKVYRSESVDSPNTGRSSLQASGSSRSAALESFSCYKEFYTPVGAPSSSKKDSRTPAKGSKKANVSSQSVVYEVPALEPKAKTKSPIVSSLNVAKSSVSASSNLKTVKPTVSVVTQTDTISKPVLSICPGPSHWVRPKRLNLGWTKIEVFSYDPVPTQDTGVMVKPIVRDFSTESSYISIDQGTSPSVSSNFPPEAPASSSEAATQGPSVPSPPGPPAPSSGVATQGLSPSPSPSFPSTSKHRNQEEEDSDSDSEAESIVLADPSDPASELLSASESFALLKNRIVKKYPVIKTETKIVEKSSFQAAFEKDKTKSIPLRMTSAVTLRLAAIDEELKIKKASSSSTITFSPYLKSKDFRYYATEISPEFEAQASVLASMAGVLDQFRVKKIKNSKVAFKFTELDSIFKSAFRALEIWSYASASFEVLGDCFLNLREKLPQEHKEVAIQYASLLRCIDIALARLQISSAISSLRKGNMSCP